jgi:amino acid adenylation domain-containing protein
MLKIASWLRRQHGIGPGSRVVLCLPTGLLAAQLVLGVLAAGASYMPLQFNGPADRLDAMLASFEPHLLITTQEMASKLNRRPGAAKPVSVVTIDPVGGQLAEILGAVAPLPRPVAVDPKSLAAVYFTSGSTGEPKGVMFSHDSMAAALSATMTRAALRETDRFISVTALHYAASLKLFNPITAGCQSYVATDEEAMFPEQLAEIMEKEGTTVWHATATQLRQLVDSGQLKAHGLRALRSVRLVGDRMPAASLRAAMDLLPQASFQNRYGASEAFAILAYDLPQSLPDDFDELPLGTPTGCYEPSLRDEEGNEVPPGETGEICAIGPAVLVGYWKQPELTAAVRVRGMPHSYRTGDLARLDSDGNYRFVGRRDHQVKILGHRFELGEIETVLKAHPAVRDAVAFAVSDDNGNQQVRACVLSGREDDLGAELKAICARKLPAFARPAHIVVLGRFPQLASGKVDRMSLQRLTMGRVA